MKVYRVKVGFGSGSADDNWLVSGETFEDAMKQAVKTAKKRLKEFTIPGRDITALEYIGEVEQ